MRPINKTNSHLLFLVLFVAALLALPGNLALAQDQEGTESFQENKENLATKEKDPSKLKIGFISGRPSHGYGSHEHYAGCMLLAKTLESGIPGLSTTVFKHEWPSSDELSGFDAVIMYCDGGDNHPVNKNLEQIQKLADEKVGVICIHYGVEVPKGEPGDNFLEWIGGYFETHWSVNPHWTAEFKELPDHAITRGVNPFTVNDEWYYHMRFREDMDGVTPILSAIPPKETLSRPDGPHSGNPHVRREAGQPQHVAWAMERENGGRGFGFTGGHYHWNWGNKDYLRLVANAIVWTAGGDVPEDGVKVEKLGMSELAENQDSEQPENFDASKIKDKFNIEK